MMHFGTVLYGKVHEVPDLFYVKTQFFHVNFLPLFPVKSFVIRAGTETEGNFSGRSVGWNLRSIVTAYGRACLFLAMAAGFAATILTAMLCGEGHDYWDYLGASLVCQVGAAGLLYGSFRWARWMRPNAARALEFARILGISLEELAQHCVTKNIHLTGTGSEAEPALD